MLGVEVDRLRPKLAGLGQPVRQRIDGEYTTCPEQLRADDGEQPDRSAAEDANRVALLDLGDIGTEIPCREDVRQKDRRVVAQLIGQLDERRVGERDAGELCLESIERSGRLRAAEKSGAGRLAV